MQGNADLFKIIDALNASSRFASARLDGGQQDCRDQDRDDRDHDQKLDEREPKACVSRQPYAFATSSNPAYGRHPFRQLRDRTTKTSETLTYHTSLALARASGWSSQPTARIWFSPLDDEWPGCGD